MTVAMRVAVVGMVAMPFRPHPERDARTLEHLGKAQLACPRDRDVAEGKPRARGDELARKRVIDQLARGEAGRGAADLEAVGEGHLDELEARPIAVGQLERDARERQEALFV